MIQGPLYSENGSLWAHMCLSRLCEHCAGSHFDFLRLDHKESPSRAPWREQCADAGPLTVGPPVPNLGVVSVRSSLINSAALAASAAASICAREQFPYAA